MLWRALRRRCPRCGSGGLFRGWFQMVETCPGCGCRFEATADEGFFLGVLTINLAVIEGALLLVIFAYIAVLAASGGGMPLWPVLTGAGVLAVVLPIVFYPFACTIWAAVNIGLHAERERPGRDRR
jgi:uncharacterized protein (DUF983 family)